MRDEPGTADQLSSGLPDEAFVTDGLLTKRVLRAYALAMLAPRVGELLWDLGAGTGSIGIEWCRLHPANRGIAIERDTGRVERILANAAAFGVPDRLEVRTANVEDVLDELAMPDAAFMGGGVRADTLDRCWDALRPGGRLVVHSVTADSDAVLLAAHQRWGGELNRIAVEVAEPIGRFTGFRPLRTVTTWASTRR